MKARISSICTILVAAVVGGLAAAAVATTPAPAAATPAPAANTAPAATPATALAPSRFTFSWPLDSGAPAPRGGTSKGPPVTVDTQESPAWRALHEPGLTALERDRRAILAMAGDYRVAFDFLEVATFKPGALRDRPYQSWGTERVYIDRDTGSFISLVHILEMRIIKPDGAVSEPMVTKHWRQDWQYEPKDIVEYQGRDRWARRTLTRQERSGQWSQTVYQVDESPRYASVARWQHAANVSTWISGDTWRPLPRREWTVRKDYQVLSGTNRVTIIASGWLQEENNLKTVLTAERAVDAAGPLAREYGVARYERLRGADFAAATEYFERTRGFWDEVSNTWATLFHDNAQITLRAPVDQAGLFEKLFAYADELADGKTPAAPRDEVIRNSLKDMGAPVRTAGAVAITGGALATVAAGAAPAAPN
jgi:hypothetical protein